MPAPFCPGCDVGMNCACNDAYLPALSGRCPVSTQGASGFILLFSPSALSSAIGVLGRECCSIVPVGVYASLPTPLSSPPAFVGSGFLLWRHALALCGRLVRLRAVSVAASAPRFSGPLTRGSLSGANWRENVDCCEFPARPQLRRGPPDLPTQFCPRGGGRPWLSSAFRGTVKSGEVFALPSPSKLPRGFNFGMQSCQSAGGFTALPRFHRRRFRLSSAPALFLG